MPLLFISWTSFGIFKTIALKNLERPSVSLLYAIPPPLSSSSDLGNTIEEEILGLARKGKIPADFQDFEE